MVGHGHRGIFELVPGQYTDDSIAGLNEALFAQAFCSGNARRTGRLAPKPTGADLSFGVEDFLVVTIGRGVGMGIVLNGQLYRGKHGGAGEIGHTVLDPDGPLCGCGNRGCLETYVSDPHLLRMAAEAAAQGALRGEVATVEDLLALARDGDHAAQAIYAQVGEKLGRTIANLINALNPTLIIISGEGMRAADFIVESLHATIDRHVMPGLAGDADVRIDLMSDDAWARGAASLVLQELFKTPFYRTATASLR